MFGNKLKERVRELEYEVKCLVAEKRGRNLEELLRESSVWRTAWGGTAYKIICGNFNLSIDTHNDHSYHSDMRILVSFLSGRKSMADEIKSKELVNPTGPTGNVSYQKPKKDWSFGATGPVDPKPKKAPVKSKPKKKRGRPSLSETLKKKKRAAYARKRYRKRKAMMTGK